MEAIAIENLTVVRGGREVLHNLSVSIPAGKITALLGPSGCGKTTLLRCVVGAQIIRSGQVLIGGVQAGSKNLRGEIGYATQNPAVYADLTVVENLRYFAGILGCVVGEVERVLQDVRLVDHQDQMVASLSGGEHSRSSLAVALLGAPKLLILDEPTADLDPLLRDQLWSLFRKMADSGTTILISSHVMDEAKRCDQLLLMREGSIIAADAPDALKARTGAEDLEGAFLKLVQDQEMKS